MAVSHLLMFSAATWSEPPLMQIPGYFALSTYQLQIFDCVSEMYCILFDDNTELHQGQTKKRCIGILAIQSAFKEHRTILEKLGTQVFEIRQKKNLEEHETDGRMSCSQCKD